LVFRLTDFDTAKVAIGAQHKIGIKRAARHILGWGFESFVTAEGMASISGDAATNALYAAGRQQAVEQYLYAVLRGLVPIDETATDAFRESLLDIGWKPKLTSLPSLTNAQGRVGRLVMTQVPNFATRRVIMVVTTSAGDVRHRNAQNDPTYDKSRGPNDPVFRAVELAARRFEPRKQPETPPPLRPDTPRAFTFRMRVSEKQPIQPKDFNKLISNGLTALKPFAKLSRIAKALEWLDGKLPKFMAAAGKAADFVKMIKYAMGMLGIEIIAFDIMDDQTKRGGVYIYFGIAPSTDVVLDVISDAVVDALTAAVTAASLGGGKLIGDLLEQALIKLHLKDLADRVKKFAQLDLIGPFPFSTMTVTTDPAQKFHHVGLDDFQGGFAVLRVGGTLHVNFDDGVGPVKQRPAPHPLELKTGATHSPSFRFGLIGVIFKGADIPYA
jgi:hypothetical protein